MKSNCQLTLFVNGPSASSLKALRNLAKICASDVPGEYPVKIIDISTDAATADASKVMWTPTLIKTFPYPERRIVGDLSDARAVLKALDLPFSNLDAEQGASRRKNGTPDAPALLEVLLIAAVSPTEFTARLTEVATVTHVPTVQEAICALPSRRFDVALVDRDVEGGLNGALDAIERVRAELAIAVLSGAGDATGAVAALSRGAEDVIDPQGLDDERLHRRLRDSIHRHRAHDRFRRLLEAHPDGIIIIDARRSVLFANPSTERLLARSRTDLLGKPFDLPLSEDTLNQNRFKVGPDRYVETRVSVVEWSGRTAQLVCMRDVTSLMLTQKSATDLVESLMNRNAQLIEDATHDPLTHALNRRGLLNLLLGEISKARRSNRRLSALLIDVDNFKGINDSLGHSVGDLALQLVAGVASKNIRPQDGLGRIGGDEFLVILPETNTAEAVTVGTRILRQLRAEKMPECLADRSLTVSIGYAEVPFSATTIEDAVGAASSSLKIAKMHGKHRVALAPSARRAPLQPTSQLAQYVSEPRELRVMTQVIVDIRDARPVGYELVVRGPSGEFEMPHALFELARTLDLTATFDLHCLKATLSRVPTTPLARHVNIVPLTLTEPHADESLALLRHHGSRMPLCVEIDGMEIIGDPLALKRQRLLLREAGIKVALDHAAFERRTFETLIVLEPDIVKVDVRPPQSGVKGFGHLRDLKRLCGAISIAGADVIAVGVETREMRDFIVECGVKFAQGHLWGAPENVGLGGVGKRELEAEAGA